MNSNQNNKPIKYLIIYSIIISIISLIGAKDYFVWAFELFVGFLGVGILALTYKKFKFSNLIYILVAIHFTILALGAHYTYAEMPLFTWLKEVLNLSRNHFDRVGHFFQGFVPVMIAREILIRNEKIKDSKMLIFILISIALAISAFWELLEMAFVILFYPNSGPAWLGIQGDMWDAQKDMLMALIGSITALICLTKTHNNSMKKLEK